VKFAYVVTATILAEAKTLPVSARRLDNGVWVLNLAAASVEVQRACGWFQVVAVPRPLDTPTTTFTRSLILIGGEPTEQWTERAKTQAELDAVTRAINTAILVGDATTNIDTLLASVVALNAITALSNATINANPAAVIKDLTREVKTVARQAIRLARLATNSTLTADSGT
jgi:hypothetical protein